MDQSTQDKSAEGKRVTESEEWSQAFIGRLRRFFIASVKEVRLLNCEFT
jgi:hypothetical protein